MFLTKLIIVISILNFVNCKRTLTKDDVRSETLKTYLNFNTYGITEINSNAFDDVQNDVRHLNLGDNEIEALNGNTFKGLTNLQTLSLGLNRIKQIDVDLFKSLTNLQDLWLNTNEIDHIHVDTFNGLVNLREIYLNGNRLRTIQSNTFKGLVNLKVKKNSSSTL
jgi:Leucine-rich repeat (LRR) protein